MQTRISYLCQYIKSVFGVLGIYNFGLLGCSFKSPAEHNYNMLRGAAYEEGRIHQKELDPKDCAMKITNIIQADDGNWNCNVTSKLSNGEYDIGK